MITKLSSLKGAFKLILPIVMLCLAVPALADEAMRYNIVNLSASSSKPVDNDVMVTLMRAVAESDRAADAARKVNEQLAWADEIIKANKSITYRSMNYQTQPIYQNQQVTGWSVSQQIHLESSDIETLTGLVGTLQQRLQVVSLNFEISPDRRKAATDALLVEALGAFKNKAELITRTLGAEDYRLVSISVNENNRPAPYRRFQAEAMAVQAAPVVEAGDSEVMVSIDGSIQIIY